MDLVWGANQTGAYIPMNLGRINIIGLLRRLFIKTFGGSKDIWLGENVISFTVSHVYFFVGEVFD